MQQSDELCTRPFVFGEEKSKLISLDDLKETRMLKDSKKEFPKSRPYSHAQMIEKLMNAMDSMNITHTEPEIYVAESMSHFDDRLERLLGADNALGCWFFDKLVGRIRLPGNNGYEPGVAFGYNERGVTFAFGLDVRVCKNFNIFGKRYVTTYGNGKVSFQQAFELILSWLQNNAEHFQRDVRIMEAMKEVLIEKKGRSENEFIGRMQRVATQQYLDSSIVSPFTQTQINALTKMIVIGDYIGMPEEVKASSHYSLYDLHMMCSQIITHSTTNLEDKWERIATLGEFVENEYLTIPA